MQGGTFTISNQGGIGGAHFTPIVNKPEVAILGLGRGTLKAVVKNGKVEPRLMLPVCVSYDHRVIDGGTAARFVTDLVQAFEGFTANDLKPG
jgi:pyruvate dehydrogenase E2 component (dihydrolipoamide acetyltransferase)